MAIFVSGLNLCGEFVRGR